VKNIFKILALICFSFLSLSANAANVAVVSYKNGYYHSLAKHLSRCLEMQGINDGAVTGVDTLNSALSTAKIAFLVGFESPKKSEIAILKSYVRRGGKLVVFHSASPELASLMGVKPIGYKTASYPGQWSRMNFTSKYPEGIPAQIRQTSTALQRAVAIPGRSRVIATWSDRNGQKTGDAAWIVSSAGYWMTHVLLADGDEDCKSRLIAAMVGGVLPSLWNFNKSKEIEKRRHISLRAFAKKQLPQKGEIRAVWDHSGCGLYPGNWKKTIKVLRESRVTDLFVNVAGAGFAHYPSSVLPRSKIFEEEGDQLKKCIESARGSGIRVHAWIYCFNTSRATGATISDFRSKGWLLRDVDGKTTQYLNPANSAVRRYILSAVRELQAKYDIDGIHLDFVRWYERGKKPKDAAQYISSFVSSARRVVRRPAWLTTAVFGKYPACVSSVGQDWTGWIDSNVVDYVVPMDYTDSNETFKRFLNQHAAKRSRAMRTIAGIGVTANESRLDARQVIEQINLARKYGMAGVALFDLDITLEKNILPYLNLGIW
jgi:uncharacterized lipoprotein YddW (UPF0748 family)